MSVLNDELIDHIANLCWYYQGERMKAGENSHCICPALKDMVYITKENMNCEHDPDRTFTSSELIDSWTNSSVNKKIQNLMAPYMKLEKREEVMSNVIAFHPAKYDLINLYEVTNAEGIAQWGGEKPFDAVEWYQRSPIGSRVLVSAWSSDDEDAVLIGQPIDITHIINQAIARGRGE